LGNSLASAFAQFARGDAIDYRVREQSHDAYDIDITGCRYAQFYKELGEPDLDFLLVCSADFWMAEGFGPDIKLTRTQTIMQGGSHCDFRYRRFDLKAAAQMSDQQISTGLAFPEPDALT
jgi:L-2-amino-thiazoline-4-carboxylic acid hydrolase